MASVIKVLLAEDDPSIANLMRLLCEREGFEVTTATDGHTAVLQASHFPFDLILLDTRLPRMDGLSAARKLRAQRETSRLPILFVSAMAHPDDQVRMRAAGADDILVKPFSNRELIDRIRHLVERPGNAPPFEDLGDTPQSKQGNLPSVPTEPRATINATPLRPLGKRCIQKPRSHHAMSTSSLKPLRNAPNSHLHAALPGPVSQLNSVTGACPEAEDAGQCPPPLKDPLADLLRRAIIQEELVLNFQPLVDARSRRLIAMEAVLRWESPDLGTLPAGSVIPLAEQCGLIQPVTLWVLNQAFSQFQAWQTTSSSFRLSVNLSPICLQEPGFARRVAVMLRSWGMTPQSLEFELSTCEDLDDLETAQQNLERLRGIGVQITLDHFGHGNASLRRLKQLPCDGIKIDRSLGHGYAQSAVDRAIVEGMLAIARSMGWRAIANGIDSEDALASLADLGFDVLQGDAIGSALPPDAFEARWLTPRA